MWEVFHIPFSVRRPIRYLFAVGAVGAVGAMSARDMKPSAWASTCFSLDAKQYRVVGRKGAGVLSPIRQQPRGDETTVLVKCTDSFGTGYKLPLVLVMLSRVQCRCPSWHIRPGSPLWVVNVGGSPLSLEVRRHQMPALWAMYVPSVAHLIRPHASMLGFVPVIDPRTAAFTVALFASRDLKTRCSGGRQTALLHHPVSSLTPNQCCKRRRRRPKESSPLLLLR